jgi:transposase
MTWKVSSAMSERLEFVTLILAAEEQGLKVNISNLCGRFQISRKTGYKWLNRFLESGRKLQALEDLSRRPVNSPQRTSAEMEQLVLALRREHPYWGARKLRALMQMLGYDEDGLPAPSTITEILRRHGMISPGKNRRRESTMSASSILIQTISGRWISRAISVWRMESIATR